VSDVRVGLFVCHCGSNIGGVVDVPAVAAYGRTLPHVAHADTNLYSCSEEGLSSLKQSIKEHDLNRVVVASCTPRTHEALFRDACEEAGVNRYLFEFVNIREHCSWIHTKAQEAATDKAKRLVRMGVAKACLLEPQTEAQSPVIPAALVLGGGIAGLTAALNLARQGFHVHLVEKEAQLGGRLLAIDRLSPTGADPKALIEPLLGEVDAHARITVHLGATVSDVGGYVGNFTVVVGERELQVGTIIVATGAEVHEPDREYAFGELDNVLTQLDLEARFRDGPVEVDAAVFIQCVGARIPERPYCSRVCCMTALKNAPRLKEQNPRARVFVLHRDLFTPGVEAERYYRRAMAAGVRFLRYDLAHPPRVVGNGRAEFVAVRDALRGQNVTLPADLVVLSTPLVAGGENLATSRLLKAPLGESGFFLEAHVKLRPVEFATDGVFLCGTARWPADVSETVVQAGAAAAKAAIPMRAGAVTAEAISAWSDPQRCTSCGTCIGTCPYGAIEMQDTAIVNVVSCKGCGCCVAACPNGAMQQRGFTDEQVLRMLEVCA
jgi:heterodisulfide reductase subunit A